jgi:hypothetical protein
VHLIEDLRRRLYRGRRAGTLARFVKGVQTQRLTTPVVARREPRLNVVCRCRERWREDQVVSELFSRRVTIVDGSQREVFAFDAAFAVLDIGAQGNEGDLHIRRDDGEPKIHLDGGRQLINVTNAAGVTVLRFDASHSLLDLGAQSRWCGRRGRSADLRLRRSGQPEEKPNNLGQLRAGVASGSSAPRAPTSLGSRPR